MLNNLRRKRLQVSNIRTFYFPMVSDSETVVWWLENSIGISNQAMSIGTCRYLKKKIDVSFVDEKAKTQKKSELIQYVMNMIVCPSGKFIMGAMNNNENPLRWVTIEKPFLLGETLITSKVYESVMGINPSEKSRRSHEPVENVSWYDAVMFCNALSDIFGFEKYYTIGELFGVPRQSDKRKKDWHRDIEINPDANGFRLPTDEEWEYAAKAKTQNKWAGTNSPALVGDYAWYDNNSKGTTHSVKQKKPNEWGFYDMSGNVFDWCENKIYRTHLVFKDQEGIATDWYYDVDYDFDKYSYRICGGSYASNQKAIEITNRQYANSANSKSSHVGFRIARYI